jgi:hypothetical protein
LVLEVDQVLTPVELSRRLGVHIQTVQFWRDNGRGPAFFKLADTYSTGSKTSRSSSGSGPFVVASDR